MSGDRTAILVMGLPGSGKSTISRILGEKLYNPQLLNADFLRELYDDWDFSIEGRIRQANRMIECTNWDYNHIIYDFICPLNTMRQIVNPNKIIWMDTIKTSRYPDTDIIFEPPYGVNNLYHITDFSYNILDIIKWIEGNKNENNI